MVQNYCDEMIPSMYVEEGVATALPEDVLNVMIPPLNSSLVTST
jgi:hypothetical protein